MSRLYWTLFIAAMAVLALVLTLAPVKAHSWYFDQRNPVTGWGCCGGQDCLQVDVNRVEEAKDEFIVDGKWHFAKAEAMPSPDGQYHACIWGGKPRCFFFPANV